MNKKDDVIETEGIVTEILRDALFRVQLDNGVMLLAHTSGRVRKSRIRILVQDRVLVAISKYGVNREGVAMGRIIRRLKNESAAR